jgi:predicted butyrate kinase (DUF1464 family)
VLWEKSIPTKKIAQDPMILIKSLQEIGGSYHLIAGPSGYGAPLICNEDIVDPMLFASEILLLTSIKELFSCGSDREGLLVYQGLAKAVKALWEKGEPVCYIPSVILLDTVPLKYKINKIDLGTADKLAASLLGLHVLSRRSGLPYEKTSFVLIESGYGYNAVITVSEGRIVNGYGGTLMEQGFLTAGPLDLEVVVVNKHWRRTDVFSGGVSTACKTTDLREALGKSDVLCNASIERMIEAIEEKIAIETKKHGISQIIFSGRNFRVSEFTSLIERRIDDRLHIHRNIGLEGYKIAKEAAQGYAVIAEGLAHGYFEKMLQHAGIFEAHGTIMDYIIHPSLKKQVEAHKRAYKKSLKKEKAEEILNSYYKSNR